MKYVKQIAIVLGITMVGELLNKLLPLPVPAGVYGLFILLAALVSGVVKLESVEATGNFLIDIMSIMFLPAMVGVMECADMILQNILPFLVIILVSTIAVMSVTGRVAQWMMKTGKKKED
jgi:holin-like protein